MQNPPSNNAHGNSGKKNYKLIVDPHLSKGQEKLTRFNGNAYSSQNHNQPLLIVRDPRPRISRLWPRREKSNLPVPRYKVDEHYIGLVPPREITFSKLNDNVTKEFLERMCGKFGKMERVRVYYHPKSNKHMGLAKVIFASIKAATLCVDHLHQTSIMGNIINAEIDCKGELLKHLHHKIIKGEMMADTMPDVIKHTQEKVKPVRKERRKYSSDDPRRHSQSDFQTQMEDDNGHGPKTPPMSNLNSLNNQGTSTYHPKHSNPLSRHSSTTVNDLTSVELAEVFNDSQHSLTKDQINCEKIKKLTTKERENITLSYAEVRKGNLLEELATMDLETEVAELIAKETKKITDQKNEKYSFSDQKLPQKRQHSTDTSTCSSYRKVSSEFSQDLEDGEYSGDEPSNDVTTSEERQSKVKLEPDTKKISPTVIHPDLGENTSNSTQLFCRSPSPNAKVPPHPSHRDFDHHRHHHSPTFYRQPPRNRGSPEQRSSNLRYHPDRFEHRRRSPSFDIHRRHSPPSFPPPPLKNSSFDSLRRHQSPPFRGRPPQFRLQRAFPPDVVRNPMSGFDQHRRSMSPPPPRRFPSPPHRREVEGNVPRDRFFPHGTDIRHRREFSSRIPEYERHRRKSPSYHHRHHRPPTPEKRRLREHRDLPTEFLERWNRRSQSPVSRRDRDHPRPYHLDDAERWMKHKLSLSPNSHHSNQATPRIRSPVFHPSDNNSCSPGDLAVKEIYLEEPNTSTTELTESDRGFQISEKVGEFLDHDKPIISLDERLRELTGEPLPEYSPHSPVKSSKNHSPVWSEDMDISSEEGNTTVDCQPPLVWNHDSKEWNHQFDPNHNFMSEEEQRRMWNARHNYLKNESPHMRSRFGPHGYGMSHDARMLIPCEQKRFPWIPLWEKAWAQRSQFQQDGVSCLSFQGFDFNKQLCNFILNHITGELKEIIKRDLNKKMIEMMAFKVYDQWWDDQHVNKTQKIDTKTLSNKNKIIDNKNVKNSTTNVLSKNSGNLLNTFDPLNWAKGSFEMDGFRIGLGLRSAISKMPSFRVKKRTPTPPSIKKEKEKGIENKFSLNKKQCTNNRKRIWQDLDSEGEEDAGSETDSLIETQEKLNVDEVFSSSSSFEEDENSEEDDTDEETESGSEVEEDNAEKISKKETFKRPSSSDLTELEPTNKKQRKLKNSNFSETDMVNRYASKKNTPTLELPHLKPNFTEEQVRSAHLKKRCRLLSKDETSNLDLIAEVSNRLRSEDEVSNMSDKEKAALEALTGMKTTPERRLSSLNSRFSECSDSSEQPLNPFTPGRHSSENVISPPVTPIVLRRASSGMDIINSPLASLVRDTKSGSDELEAVEALLSIKQSQPIMGPLSPPVFVSNETRKPLIKKSYQPPTKRLITVEDRERMTAIAEEHNYFAISPASNRPKYYMTKHNEIVRGIYEEHSYCQLPIHLGSSPSTISQPDLWKRDTPVSKQQISTTVERVKLHHEKLEKTSKRVKKDIWKPAEQFRPRTSREEISLIYSMLTNGLDLEDMKLLRHEYEEMLANPNAPSWVQDTHWTSHSITNIEDTPQGYPYKRRTKKDKISPDVNAHKTGCLRSEGYYKVGDTTKLQQRRLMYRQTERIEEKVGRRNQTDTPANPAFLATEKSREERQLMRRIVSEFGSDASDLLKYNQLAYRKKSVKFKRSSIHGWGLFSEETIGADEMVIEYVGQLVRSLMADRREVDYTKRGIGSSYLFRIDGDHIIDATKCGNYARFMNHSCNPSCYAKVITVDGAKKIVIYSKDTIKPNDEITYDYKFPIEEDKIPCFCGAHNCRGTLN